MIDRRLQKINAIVLFLCLCYCLCLCANPQAGEDTDAAWKNRPEKVTVEGVDNHFSFIFHRDTSSDMTVIRLFINAGKKAEPENLGGLAFLTTRLSVEIPDQSTVRELMNLASSFSPGVEGDHCIITIRCLSEKLEDTLKILAGILKKPLFSGLRIDHIKKNMKFREKSEEDNGWTLMRREYFTLFFGNTSNGGYGGSIYGDDGSRKKIRRKHVTGFFKKYFNLSNIVFSVSSNLDKAEITELMKRFSQSLPPGEPVEGHSLPPVKPVTVGGASKPAKKDHFIKKEKTQALVCLGALLPGTTPVNFTRAYMLEVLLGEGIGSRLWPLRAVENLAYRMQAKVIHMKDAGLLTVCLETDKTKKEKAFKALKEMMNDLYQKGVTEAELASAKVRAWSYFLRNNETRENRSYTLGYFEAVGLGFEFPGEFFSHIKKVTREDFNAYIKRVLRPDDLVKVVIGPEEN